MTPDCSPSSLSSSSPVCPSTVDQSIHQSDLCPKGSTSTLKGSITYTSTHDDELFTPLDCSQPTPRGLTHKVRNMFHPSVPLSTSPLCTVQSLCAPAGFPPGAQSLPLAVIHDANSDNSFSRNLFRLRTTTPPMGRPTSAGFGIRLYSESIDGTFTSEDTSTLQITFERPPLLAVYDASPEDLKHRLPNEKRPQFIGDSTSTITFHTNSFESFCNAYTECGECNAHASVGCVWCNVGTTSSCRHVTNCLAFNQRLITCPCEAINNCRTDPKCSFCVAGTGTSTLPLCYESASVFTRDPPPAKAGNFRCDIALKLYDALMTDFDNPSMEGRYHFYAQSIRISAFPWVSTVQTSTLSHREDLVIIKLGLSPAQWISACDSCLSMTGGTSWQFMINQGTVTNAATATSPLDFTLFSSSNRDRPRGHHLMYRGAYTSDIGFTPTSYLFSVTAHIGSDDDGLIGLVFNSQYSSSTANTLLRQYSIQWGTRIQRACTTDSAGSTLATMSLWRTQRTQSTLLTEVPLSYSNNHKYHIVVAVENRNEGVQISVGVHHLTRSDDSLSTNSSSYPRPQPLVLSYNDSAAERIPSGDFGILTTSMPGTVFSNPILQLPLEDTANTNLYKYPGLFSDSLGSMDSDSIYINRFFFAEHPLPTSSSHSHTLTLVPLNADTTCTVKLLDSIDTTPLTTTFSGQFTRQSAPSGAYLIFKATSGCQAVGVRQTYGYFSPTRPFGTEDDGWLCRIQEEGRIVAPPYYYRPPASSTTTALNVFHVPQRRTAANVPDSNTFDTKYRLINVPYSNMRTNEEYYCMVKIPNPLETLRFATKIIPINANFIPYVSDPFSPPTTANTFSQRILIGNDAVRAIILLCFTLPPSYLPPSYYCPPMIAMLLLTFFLSSYHYLAV